MTITTTITFAPPLLLVLLLCASCNGQSEPGTPEASSESAADEAGNIDGDDGSDAAGDVCPNVAESCPEECFALEGAQVIGDCYGGYGGILGCTLVPEDGLGRAGLIGCVKRISDAALFNLASITDGQLLVEGGSAWEHCTEEERERVTLATEPCP